MINNVIYLKDYCPLKQRNKSHANDNTLTNRHVRLWTGDHQLLTYQYVNGVLILKEHPAPFGVG